MPLIEWNEKLSVNVKAMDTQHVKLVNILNKLHDAMMSQKGSEVISETLKELIDYTKSHFKSEEELLTKYNYPVFPTHKGMHDKFTAAILDYQGKFKSGSKTITIQLSTFLKDWLTQHIMNEDKKYGEYLKGKI